MLNHGYGLPASDLTDRLGLIDPGGECTVVVTRAPFEHKGQAIWHRALLPAPEEATAQFHQSVASLDALMGSLVDELGSDLDRAVVGGFSQGGGIGIGLLLAAGISNRPGAAFGVCSFPPAFGGFVVDRATTGRPCFLSSAHGDHFAPIEASRAGAALLAGLGLDLTYVETDTDHVMTDEAADAVGNWLARLDDVADRREGHELFADIDGRHEHYDDLWQFAG